MELEFSFDNLCDRSLHEILA